MTETRLFSGWVYISRAEDLPGVWVAHCLDFNIVSQGDSPVHALEMVHEALTGTLVDDIARGFDPDKRRSETDPSDWALLLQLLKRASKIGVREMDELARVHTWTVFATQLSVAVLRPQTGRPNVELVVEEEVVRAA